MLIKQRILLFRTYLFNFIIFLRLFIRYFDEIELLFRLIKVLFSRVIQKNIHDAPPIMGLKYFWSIFNSHIHET